MEDYSNSQPMSFTNDIVYRAKYVQEAIAQGLRFGTNTFRVFHQLRWFECEGKYHWSVAGTTKLAEYINLTEKEVKNALDELKRRGVVQHILTDTRWYRKKTDLWATTIELKKRGIDYEKYCIQAHNKNPQEVLKTACPPAETACPPAETACPPADATPVTTEVGNNKQNNKKIYIHHKQNEEIPQETHFSFPDGKSSPNPAETSNAFPFENEPTYVDINKTAREKERRRQQAELSDICRAVAEEFGDKRKASNNDLRRKIGKLLERGYSKKEILLVAHNWKDLKNKDGIPFGFGIFKDTMFDNLLGQEPEGGKFLYGGMLWG